MVEYSSKPQLYFFHSELVRSDFRRTFRFDQSQYEDWISKKGEEAITASLDNGVLSVRLKDFMTGGKEKRKKVEVPIVSK